MGSPSQLISILNSISTHPHHLKTNQTISKLQHVCTKRRRTKRGYRWTGHQLRQERRQLRQRVHPGQWCHRLQGGQQGEGQGQHRWLHHRPCLRCHGCRVGQDGRVQARRLSQGQQGGNLSSSLTSLHRQQSEVMMG